MVQGMFVVPKDRKETCVLMVDVPSLMLAPHA